MIVPRQLRIDGAMYVRTDRGDNVDPYLLKLLNLLQRDEAGPQPLARIVQQYRQSHPEVSEAEVYARLTALQLAGLVARHARGPGGQLGGSTTHEEYSVSQKGLGFLHVSAAVAKPKYGAGLLFVTRRHVLLLQRSADVGNPGTWGLAGGQLHPAEAPWTGARREAREELGTLPAPLKARQHFLRDTPRHHFDVYVVRLPSAQRQSWRPRINHEHTAWRWFPCARLPRKLHPAVAWLVQTHPDWCD